MNVPPSKESGDTITAKGQRERLYELMRERAEKAEAERDALREALEEIAKTGPVFDAKGTWSKRVCEIARAALGRPE